MVTTESGSFVRFEVGLDVRLLLVVRHANRIGGSLGSLERVRHSERDVLAVVANDIVLERRAPLFADAFHPLSQGRAQHLANVLAMKDRAHTGHLLGRARIEFDNPAVGDRRLDRNGIQQPGKVEVGGVLRLSAHLHRAIDARRAHDQSVM